MRKKFIKTANALRFLAALDDLTNRGAEEACFLVVDGEPGVGKTETTEYLAVQHGWIFVRAKAGWTECWLLRDILDALRVPPAHSFERMHKQVLQALAARADAAARAGEVFAVVIDEVDHIVRREKLLETLRDVSDFLEIPFILVGMGRVRHALGRYPQIASRVGQPVPFERATAEDVRALAEGLCEVPVAPDLVAALHQASGGLVREIKEGLAAIERWGRRNPGPVSVASMAGQVLLLDRKTGQPILVRE